MNILKLVIIGIGSTSMPTLIYANYANNIHNYLWANYNQYSGKNNEAQQWYQPLLTSNPPIYYYKGYLNLLFETSKFDEIVKRMPELETSFSEDAEIQQLFAQALQKVGQQDESDNRFIKLNAQFKNNQAIAFQTAGIYTRRKEPENALATIDNLLNSSPKKPNNFVFYFLKAQLYTQLNDQPKALENVKECLKMHSHFDKGWLLLALLEEQAGRLQEAIKGFTTFLELSDGGNREIEQHLAQLAFKQKMLKSQHNSLAIAQTNFAKAAFLFNKKDYAGALSFIDASLQKTPSDNQSKVFKIEILTAMNKQTQAAMLLKTWILEEPQNETWFKTLHLLCQTGLQQQKAISILQDIAHAQPKNLLPLLYLADLTTRTKHLDTALNYHKKALALVPEKTIATKILFQMALLYHRQQKFDDMEKVLEQGHALKLDFPPLLNLLAYHYAKSDKNLEQATLLVQTALQKNKNNPHFLDTQALVLYKKGEYPKALTLLEAIAQQQPDDTAILTTLGKTHYKMGNHAQAIKTLEHALEVANNDHDKKQFKTILKKWNNGKS